MQTRPFTYLFSLSYYGARFKGWAIQKGQPTVQGKLERVFRFVLGNDDFTILGGSRTDSGVSCRHGYFQLFSKEAVDWTIYLASLNENLAGEIQLLEVREVNRDFNLIEQIEAKTYRYYFSTGPTHSFAS
ncbi:MAG TPA: tRNA pseudouridine(38-40) synthase TruA, partial [Algoriphagus sp.]|nr:tRNA pseudouridine(38-40) synthase TruA [Algoriphagus sp.]